jgi:peptidoglycan/xylan/chitin deacetylase (PgdA/CDA1 family)
MQIPLATRVRDRLAWCVSRLRYRRSLKIGPGTPLISFTFDDFPRTALINAGAILKRHQIRATYYGAFGLMGTNGPVGELFLPEDVELLLNRGHELGCHTYGHNHAFTTTPDAFEASILNNRRLVDELLPGFRFRSFSYPFSFPRPVIKHLAGGYFDCCRGGGQTFNAGSADLNDLAAFFLEQTGGCPRVAKNIIDDACRAGGWLILSTHDVCAKPSRFGCTVELFEEVVEHAVRSGADILPVADALQVLISRAGLRQGAVSA